MKRKNGVLVEVAVSVAVSAVFLVLLFAFRFPFPVAAAAAVLLYLAVSLIRRPNRFRIGKIEVESEDDFKALQTTIGEGYQTLDKIRSMQKQIRDGEIRGKVGRIVATAEKIFAYLEKNPKKIRSARRFFSYYLETASHIVSRYLELSSQNIQSEEISRTLAKVSNILSVIESTFEKQLAALMSNDIMDLESEIALLENTIKMESF